MPSQTILLAGANRGLGLGLTREYLARGWQVIATARAPDKAAGLAELLDRHPAALTVEPLDVAEPASIAALAGRLAGHKKLAALFVVAGMSGFRDVPIHAVPPEGVAREFVVNASGPLTLAESLEPVLAPDSTVAFMTSVLGSIGSNTTAGWELYRGTKAALNMFAASYALRHRARPVLVIHPGWVRTDMGGPTRRFRSRRVRRDGRCDRSGPPARHRLPGLRGQETALVTGALKPETRTLIPEYCCPTGAPGARNCLGNGRSEA